MNLNFEDVSSENATFETKCLKVVQKWPLKEGLGSSEQEEEEEAQEEAQEEEEKEEEEEVVPPTLSSPPYIYKENQYKLPIDRSCGPILNSDTNDFQ